MATSCSAYLSSPSTVLTLEQRIPPVGSSRENVTPFLVLVKTPTNSMQQWSNQDEVSSVSQVDVVGAVQCVISVNDLEAQCAIHSGSKVSLASQIL